MWVVGIVGYRYMSPPGVHPVHYDIMSIHELIVVRQGITLLHNAFSTLQLDKFNNTQNYTMF
jgi:hypothetical protein